MKDLKKIKLGGIHYITELDGLPGWCWGMDYTSGDLYEAEELWQEKHRISRNRLVFLRFPEGTVFEPVKAKAGQYLGRPAFWEGGIYILLVDFSKEEIVILRWTAEEASLETAASLPLQSVKDCYNLFLTTAPLCLTRQGHENTFQVVWPEKGDFPIAPAESLDSRDGDCLLFSEWFEDPDYREETVIRRYPDGEVLRRLPGSLISAPDGERWLLE